MPREAQRTLTSLSRGYQRGVETLSYEVLCVDNGSDPPIEAGWVEGFGPEFRLIRPDQPHPSPCGPLNGAARQAKGRHLAMMIDGAHVVSPGVLREAMAVIRSDPDAVVALRQWFIGGDQRWLAQQGYTQDMEGALFNAIKWPRDGYDLFRIGAPMDESPAHWFRGLSETNCLFMPTAVFNQIGGYDEDFDEPGAGLANLDLFKRATEAATGPVVCLIGEVSFHQFHGGTTTNVTDGEKDKLVARFQNTYERLRGRPFTGLKPADLEVRGHIVPAAVRAMKQPLFPRAISLTDELRPAGIDEQFSRGVRDHMLSAFTEANATTPAYWLGEPIDLYPADLMVLQEMMTRSRPSCVVCVNTEPGLVRFVDSILALLRVEDPTIVWVTERRAPLKGITSKTMIAHMHPSDDRVPAQVLQGCAYADATMVVYAPLTSEPYPLTSLSAYAKFVSAHCYLAVLRTARGQPWIGYARSQLKAAVMQLVKDEPDLIVDMSWSRNVLTSCPSGFVRRVGAVIEAYDASLDDLSAL